MRISLAPLALLLAGWPLEGQARFEQLDRAVQNAGLRAAVLRSGRVIWQNDNITASACEEPVIAERIPGSSLDQSAPMPHGATIREVLSNTADGTPGEEILDNRFFFDALKPIARVAVPPDAIKFASKQHNSLGWFIQEYGNEKVQWCHDPSVLIVQVPEKRLALVTAGEIYLQDANIARSEIALAFFKDVVDLPVLESDVLIARALTALHLGRRDESLRLTRQALDKSPELETTADVALLYLFAQLRLPETEASATAVIKAHPSLPTAWYYYGQYVEAKKRYREAAACYEKITTHQPPWHNWTVAAAKQELTYLRTER